MMNENYSAANRRIICELHALNDVAREQQLEQLEQQLRANSRAYEQATTLLRAELLLIATLLRAELLSIFVR